MIAIPLLPLPDPAKLADRVVDQNVPRICPDRVNAREYFHQGGFSGAVFADQRVKFAFREIECHAVQSLYAGKFLDDLSHFE